MTTNFYGMETEHLIDLMETSHQKSLEAVASAGLGQADSISAALAANYHMQRAVFFSIIILTKQVDEITRRLDK